MFCALGMQNLSAQKIAYFNLNRVFNEYSYAIDKYAEINKLTEEAQAQINSQSAALQTDVETFQRNMSTNQYTMSQAESRQNMLMQRQEKLNAFMQQKNDEINAMKNGLNNEIMAAVKLFVDKYNADGHFTLILANQALGGIGDAILSVPVVNGAASLDITDVIITGLNAEYAKNR